MLLGYLFRKQLEPKTSRSTCLHVYMYICNLIARLRKSSMDFFTWSTGSSVSGPRRSLCQAPALCVSCPCTLCRVPLHSLCRGKRSCVRRWSSVCRAPALSVSGSGAVCVGPRRSVSGPGAVCQGPGALRGPRRCIMFILQRYA